MPRWVPTARCKQLGADGHAWGISHKDRSEVQTAAIGKFLKFFADNDFEWARTGDLPSVKAVLDSAAFKALPHRDTVLAIATPGTPLPPTVQRRFAIQDIVGEEMNAAIIGQKNVDGACRYGIANQRPARQSLKVHSPRLSTPRPAAIH